jgi:hypothetical protein
MVSLGGDVCGFVALETFMGRSPSQESLSSPLVPGPYACLIPLVRSHQASWCSWFARVRPLEVSLARALSWFWPLATIYLFI